MVYYILELGSSFCGCYMVSLEVFLGIYRFYWFIWVWSDSCLILEMLILLFVFFFYKFLFNIFILGKWYFCLEFFEEEKIVKRINKFFFIKLFEVFVFFIFRWL